MESKLIQEIEDLCSTETSETRLYERAVDYVFAASERYNWVGIYEVRGNELVLAGWRGPEPTQHERIPLDKGICGFVATEGETIMVRDVSADSRYLACFIDTKSEMVVPIKLDSEVIAEIDIDSDTPSAFEGDDKELIESVADRIGKRVGELRK